MSVEDIGLLMLFLVIIGIVVGGYLAIIAWAIGDAQKRGYTGCGVLVLFWLCGPLTIPLWFLIRPRKVLDLSPIDFETPEDALEAAARLDNLGDWDAAIELYLWIVDRWPEHTDYIAACMRAIEGKRSSDRHHEA